MKRTICAIENCAALCRPGLRGILFATLFAVLVGVPAARLAARDGLPSRFAAEGEAVIVGDDLEGAKKQALDTALAKAFAAALLQGLPAGLSPVRQEELVRELAPLHRDFLLQFRIVSESAADQVLLVTVEALFSDSQIREELKRRGIVEKEPREEAAFLMDIAIRGVSSFQQYQKWVQDLPKRVSGVAKVQPLEVSGTQMVLRCVCRGSPERLERAVRAWLAEQQNRPDQIDMESPGRQEVSFSFPERVGKPEKSASPRDPSPPALPRESNRAVP